MKRSFSFIFKPYIFKKARNHFFQNQVLVLPRCFCSEENIKNVEFDSEIVKKEYDLMLSECLDKNSHRCYIVQPYIKWGPSKVTNRRPDQRLLEATQLVNFIQNWSVIGGESLGVKSAKYSLGSGQLKNLSETIQKVGGVSALIFNVPLLSAGQIDELRTVMYGNPKIYDRAGIVLRLVREQVTNGTHAHAQLQLAELDYISRRYRDERSTLILASKRTELVAQLEHCKAQRELLRKKRKNTDLPVVAVVGYTNAGKSSLVSSLVGDEVCAVSEKAFHTLDVFARAGQLPSGLKLLYMDTVGFLSDIPNLLTPLFSATLEDVLLADVLLHVVDSSHEEVAQQKEHVENELKEIYKSFGQSMPPVVTVGNKLDLRRENPAQQPAQVLNIKNEVNDCSINEEKAIIQNWDLAVSALHNIGIDALRLHLEKEVLHATNRTVLNIRVPFGSEEVKWLYKNATVLEQCADQKDAQHCIVKVIITKIKIDQFYTYFVKNKKNRR